MGSSNVLIFDDILDDDVMTTKLINQMLPPGRKRRDISVRMWFGGGSGYVKLLTKSKI